MNKITNFLVKTIAVIIILSAILIPTAIINYLIWFLSYISNYKKSKFVENKKINNHAKDRFVKNKKRCCII